MTELEEARLYYTMKEATRTLHVDYRLRYVELSNKFTGKKVKSRTCANSLNQAHMYFSDYLYKNQGV